MHDIWNPWHGCKRVSPGCANCYMYFLDQLRQQDGSHIYRTDSFDYPLQKTRTGEYRIKSGELIRVCMTSDFFLPEADKWREEAWNIMYQRPDVIFFLLTKRPERIEGHLPADWGDGWENIWLNVTCENQAMADKRMPILMDIPTKHKGVMCAPFIGPVSLRPYLATGQIEQVICGGENYAGARPCHYEWVKALHDECLEYQVPFSFIETGTYFVKDGRCYHIKNKQLQSQQAYKAEFNFGGQPKFQLRTPIGFPLTEEETYHPVYDGPNCSQCGSRLICNGCNHCGKCTALHLLQIQNHGRRRHDSQKSGGHAQDVQDVKEKKRAALR